MINAIVLTPNLSLGGAERWVATMVKYSDPSRVRWHGVVVSGWGGLDLDLCAEISSVCPIYSEQKIEKTLRRQRPTPAAVSPDCEQFITRLQSLPHAVAMAGRHADVVVAWGSQSYANYLAQPGSPREMVLVSHSSHHKPEIIRRPEHCRLHLAAVSQAACRPFLVQDDQPIAVIYNGVETSRLQPVSGREAQRQAWGFPPQARVLGYIGRRTAEKNPAAAAMAVQALGLGDWRAVYYGNMPVGQRAPGVAEQAVMEWAVKAHPHIQFHDPVTQIGDVYAGLDVLMLASHSEAFSLTLLEVFCCGVPVVATPVGSVPELQEKYGPLVCEVPLCPTREQLAEACQRAISAEGQALAKKAQQLALAEFTAEKMVERWADYLERTIPARKLPGRRLVRWLEL